MALHTIDLDFAGDPADFDVTTDVEMVRAFNAQSPFCGMMIVNACGPTGYPVVRVSSHDEHAIMDAIMLYCGGDVEQAFELIEFVKTV